MMSALIGSGLLSFGGSRQAAGGDFEAKVREYAASVDQTYMASVGFPPNYRFALGGVVLPLPPIQVQHGRVFIIGAYPSAVFRTIQKRRVPADNLKMPFDAADSPGGVNASARELDKFYLKPLGLNREDCWITNLVKPFLFKKVHVDQFRALGSTQSAQTTRDEYERYAGAGLEWIDTELEIAEPKLIIALGAEVAGIIGNVASNHAREELLSPYRIHTIQRRGREYKIIYMVHPGQLMRKTEKWTKIHQTGLDSLRPIVRSILNESAK